VTLGLAFGGARGQPAPETGRAYARARELCRQVGETSQLFPALYGLSMFHLNRAELDAARDVAEEILQWARIRKDTIAAVVGHRCAGTAGLFRGELLSTIGHFKQALALYSPTHHYSEVLNPGVLTISLTAWALSLQGYPEQALERSREALTAAQNDADAHTLAIAMHQQNVVGQLRRDWRTVEERAAALMRLTAERGFAHWHATATILHGWAVAAAGAVEEGVAEMNRGLVEKQATGAQLKVPYYLGLLAAAYTSLGQESEALLLLDDAMVRVGRTKERWFEAELHRLRGEALLSLPERDGVDAEACFQRAIAVAREQGAKMWELRAAMSLARLWCEQDRCREAYELLAPIYNWFIEGFATSELKEAKALLGELQ
jgi:predicted ATPase